MNKLKMLYVASDKDLSLPLIKKIVITTILKAFPRLFQKLIIVEVGKFA